MSHNYDHLLGRSIPHELVPELRDRLRVPLFYNFKTLTIELNKVRWPHLHPEIKKAVAELLDREVANV